MKTHGDHAVVCGAGMAGLLTACALAGRYRHVTLIERDRLDGGMAARRGVPQGPHVHALFRLDDVVERLCPGLSDALVSKGAHHASARDMWMEVLGVTWRPSLDRRVVSASRPFLEHHLRNRVLNAPGVRILSGCQVTGVLQDPHGRRVTGVHVSHLGALDDPGAARPECIEADLVVDAIGRTGRGRAWLESLGYPCPPEQKMTVGVRYASRTFRMRTVQPPVSYTFVAPRQDSRRGLVLAAQENGTWVVSQTCYGDTRPPGDGDEFLEYACRLLPDEAAKAVQDAEPLSPISTYHFAAGHHRLYSKVRHHPQGLLSTGDSLCALNPVYGTGIIIAAQLALHLRHCLDEAAGGTGGTDDLAERFYHGAGRITRGAWQLNVLLDRLLNPTANSTPATRLATAALRRVIRRADQDKLLADAFLEAMEHSRPARLLRPHIMLRALAPGARSGRSA
ncbi:FAD-dependent oxidoreductase [Spirillospora sp. NPDC029432]|uniref:NAD(P)/FAD-dependent oxidoreductase n=1 Tax=Spirillospora sp. NPDC029432 TaxID=3154599 RepID=UPI0034553FCC